MPKSRAQGRAVAVKEPTTRGVRIGGRSERVVADVLRAAGAELAKRGYSNFRIEEVASAAGVNKTTIYRRWPAKADLVEAALRALGPSSREAPDTGDLESDLLELLGVQVRWHGTTEGRAVLRMLDLDGREKDLEEIIERLREEMLAPWLAAIERGKRRGQVATSLDTRLVAEMALFPAMLRLYRLGESVDATVVAAIVRIVARGAAPRLPVSRPVRRPRKT